MRMRVAPQSFFDGIAAENDPGMCEGVHPQLQTTRLDLVACWLTRKFVPN